MSPAKKSAKSKATKPTSADSAPSEAAASKQAAAKGAKPAKATKAKPAAAKPAKGKAQAKPKAAAKPKAKRGARAQRDAEAILVYEEVQQTQAANAAELMVEQDIAEAEAGIESHGGIANGHASHKPAGQVTAVDDDKAQAVQAHEAAADAVLRPDPVASAASPAAAPSSRASGLSLPEELMFVAMGDGWDDRQEKLGQGRAGAALVGALLLELALNGRLAIQRGGFAVLGEPTGDAALDAFAAEVAELKGQPGQAQMLRLGHKASRRLTPWKEHLAGTGLVQFRTWRHLGLFRRSELRLLDADAQAKLVNKLTRTLAGGGVADAQSVCLLGLLEASGILPQIVPASTLQFNHKRIQGLISGRDVLGYRVDRQLLKVSETVLRTVLDNVRLLTK